MEYRKKDVPAVVMDLREVCRGKRVIMTSDPHGCFDELMELLDGVGFNDDDICVIAGDLNDRGPKIKACFDFAMKTPNAHCLLGNHDGKLRRYLLGRPVQAKSLEATIAQLQLEHHIEEVAVANRERYFDFLDALPHMFRVTDTDYVVHAGIHPGRAIDEQTAQFCMYGGRFNPETEQYGRDTGHMWYQFYEGQNRIFFGHVVHKYAVPEHAPSGKVFALDGGCVFGGAQRAVIIPADRGALKIVEVQAKKVYFGRYTEGAN